MRNIGRHRLAALALSASAPAAGELTLFEHPDCGGRRITFRGTVSNFDPLGFNDRAASMIIGEGYWEVCADAYFRGRCATFGPGEYRSLQPSLTATVSATREVAGGPPGPPPPAIIAGDGTPRMELWEHREFGGRSIVLASGAPDFERIGLNDRAASIRVEGGCWTFCSDAFFEATCPTFAAGDDASLPWDINTKISSGRRVHEEYPYNAPPAWGSSR